MGVAAGLQPGSGWTSSSSIVKAEPAWLTGIVFGPQVRMSLPDAARGDPEAVPDPPLSRHHAQPAVPVSRARLGPGLRADRGREVDQPAAARPGARSSACFDRCTIGFITYSEGCNDDVNKFVWSALGWDPDGDGRRDRCASTAATSSATDYADSVRAGTARAGAELARPAGRPTRASIRTLRQFQAMERARRPRGAG